MEESARDVQKHTTTEAPAYDLPEDVVIILPVRSVVLFPDVVLPLTVGRRRSILAAQEAVKQNRPIGVIQQRDPSLDLPGPEDLYAMGALANVLRYVTSPDSTHHIICQGLQRFRIREFVPGYPFLAARIETIPTKEVMTRDLEAHTDHLRRQALEAIELVPQAPPELAETVQTLASPGSLCDLVTSFMDLKAPEKQEVLETVDVEKRVDRVAGFLAQRLAVLRLSHEIEQQTKESVDKRQREFLLREQLKTIQRELGEDEPRAAEHEELERQVTEAAMPPEADEAARRELNRLQRMPETAAEYSMLQTYMDWMVSLPWNKLSEAEIDIALARRILDEDHYGLTKVKRRILEYLAVLKLNPQSRSPILCLVGPPGVGKTSLGHSIARATSRSFVRIALGGVHDESEIRGHRRTYIGALPGNVIQGMRKAGTRNPVF
ncbi:MAG: LON peptidase substrate-binding domain-containing protein, partial [Chromatiales bacterium]|nr:LON peptidase substrate-binding domain-containing protein [Chromatiales bacterium]